MGRKIRKREKGDQETEKEELQVPKGRQVLRRATEPWSRQGQPLGKQRVKFPSKHSKSTPVCRRLQPQDKDQSDYLELLQPRRRFHSAHHEQLYQHPVVESHTQKCTNNIDTI